MQARRIQLSRARGWRMPHNTVKVDRTTKWGNPFRVAPQGGTTDEFNCKDAAEAVERYRSALANGATGLGFSFADLSQLKGKNLACWCKPGTPCHGGCVAGVGPPVFPGLTLIVHRSVQGGSLHGPRTLLHSPPPMPRVTIDNIEIDVPEGTTILQAARMIGERNKADRYVVPPAMCYYTNLKTSGGYCRTCIVKVSKGSEKDPRPMPKPVASCRTNVMDGMVVENTTNPELLEARKGVTEFLLINHPLDCPICDQAGECHLQDLGYEHGKEASRYEFERRTFDPIDIGDTIKLHMTRCILCYRCVKVAEQITDGRVHGVINRSDVSEISTYIQEAIDNDFSGNMIDVCPVGALTDRTFRFASRVWFTNPMDAHRNCDKCSGKVVLWLKGNEVLRVTGRKDQWGEVAEFICNTCRFETKDVTKWRVEGPRNIDRHSVIAQGHYTDKVKQKLLTTSAPDAPTVEPFDIMDR